MNPANRWKSKFSKKPQRSWNEKMHTSFRPLTSIFRSTSADGTGEDRKTRRPKPMIPVGIFMQAKSSYPDDHIKSTEPPEPTSSQKMPEFPGKRAGALKGWDFSDLFEEKPEKSIKSVDFADFEKVDKSIPLLQKLSSEDEQKPENLPGKSETLYPWQKEFAFDMKYLTKPKKASKLVENPKYYAKILNFGEQIDDSKKAETTKLALRDDSNVMLGDVERALIAIGLQTKTSETSSKCGKVYNLLVERSDWLMYREEYNDETDYLPKNPFYSRETISSDFEEYEQDLDEMECPEYLTNSEKSASEESLKFLESIDSEQNLNSQEDFFDAKPTIKNKLKRENPEKIDNFFTSPPAVKLQKSVPHIADFSSFGRNFDDFQGNYNYSTPGTSDFFINDQFRSHVTNSPRTQSNYSAATDSQEFPFFS